MLLLPNMHHKCFVKRAMFKGMTTLYLHMLSQSMQMSMMHNMLYYNMFNAI